MQAALGEQRGREGDKGATGDAEVQPGGGRGAAKGRVSAGKDQGWGEAWETTTKDVASGSRDISDGRREGSGKGAQDRCTLTRPQEDNSPGKQSAWPPVGLREGSAPGPAQSVPPRAQGYLVPLEHPGRLAYPVTAGEVPWGSPGVWSLSLGSSPDLASPRLGFEGPR